ncbi:MAG: ABC transporter permease [Chloroflexi bacterium]|nr:MAG: ABC transporter permease [Chloroflexota bacterium]TME46031.1 MAG: ABC transporter permease [Chloroflexota bacterium]
MAAATKPRSARQEPPEVVKSLRRTGRALALPIGSVLLAFIVGGVMVAVTGGNPFLTYQALICGGFGLFCFGGEPGALQLGNTLVFVTPLIMAGIAVALPFRAGMFNIGAEGQFVMGAILATVIGIHVGGLPGIVLVPLVLVGGMVAGAAWGGIVGVLKATTGAHEVVTTIMLNFVAQWFLRYLIIGGPMQLAGGSSKSSPIADNARLPYLLPHDSTIILGLPGAVYRVHAGLFIALAAAAVFAFLLWRTSLGYEIRAVGQSQRAARYAGISVRRTLIVTMLTAGAFAGLAGAVTIAGVEHNLTDQYFSDSTGFDAIAVALLGLNSAVGIVLAAILFGALHAGGSTMQSDAGVSGNLVYVLQALILFSIAANFLGSVKLRIPTIGRIPGTPQADAAAAAIAAETNTTIAADDKDIA